MVVQWHHDPAKMKKEHSTHIKKDTKIINMAYIDIHYILGKYHTTYTIYWVSIILHIPSSHVLQDDVRNCSQKTTSILVAVGSCEHAIWR